MQLLCYVIFFDILHHYGVIAASVICSVEKVLCRLAEQIFLIVFKALRFGQPKYIADMLSPPVTISHVTLRSDDDPYRLHEPRAVDERAFAERSFVYTAPRLYNGLPATVKQQASVQSFKIYLKTFLFSRAYNSNTNTINEVYKL